jgi:lipopolysaccharide export system protein LptC
MSISDNRAGKNNEQTPDAYMLNASYLRTNEQGRQNFVLFSPLITHFKHQDTAFFQKPRIFIFKDDEKWQVTSKTGKSIHGAATVYLQDDVKIRQLPSSKNIDTLLTTKSLTVFPKKNLVMTNELVSIVQPGLKINSKGLRGDLNMGQIKLLSKARGQYDPKQMH